MTTPSEEQRKIKAQEDAMRARLRFLSFYWLGLRFLGALIILGGVLVIINGLDPLFYALLIMILGVTMVIYSYTGEWNQMRSMGIPVSRARPKLGNGAGGPELKPQQERPGSIEVAAPPPQGMDPEVVGTRFCPACGTWNPEHYAYCKKCSKALPLPSA
jgi:hypothetical protein